MLVHIKEIREKRTRRIFHNILVLTFSLLLQIFRYNVYTDIYDVYIYIYINKSSAHGAFLERVCVVQRLFALLLLSIVLSVENHWQQEIKEILTR